MQRNMLPKNIDTQNMPPKKTTGITGARATKSMPLKKTNTGARAAVLPSALARMAYSSPGMPQQVVASSKEAGWTDGVKAHDAVNESDKNSVCSISEKVIINAGETSGV